MERDRIYIPVRAVSEKLGYKVDYIDNKKVIISKGEDVIELINFYDTSVAVVNGKEVPLDMRDGKQYTGTTVKSNGIIYVPIRFVVECFGGDVKY